MRTISDASRSISANAAAAVGCSLMVVDFAAHVSAVGLDDAERRSRHRLQALHSDPDPSKKRSQCGDFGRDILLNDPFDSPVFIKGYSLKATI